MASDFVSGVLPFKAWECLTKCFFKCLKRVFVRKVIAALNTTQVRAPESREAGELILGETDR